MKIQNYILATAGHVDHGKSSLVKALTGTDPDRLPEEKARGITIDLGFAHMTLPSAADPECQHEIGIVDVPGHEDFVKNMVAGVGSIDVALVIVAADDSWMPQTEEHLQILVYLGVKRAVVALTKIDLMEGEADRAAIIDEIREKLQESPFAAAPIIPTSVMSGAGLEELRASLAGILDSTPPAGDLGKPRLPIDRVFTLRGIGTVITGTLNGGTLGRGESVIVQPTGRTSRIRSMQSHNREVDISPPGTRTAVNVPDLASYSDQNPEGVRRGEVVTLPELGAATDTLDVLIEKSARLIDVKTRPARPLKNGTLVRVHHGSGNFVARIYFNEGEALVPGERQLAQLRLEAPVFAFAGDHFVVRDWAEQWTLAGGIVLDVDSPRKHFRGEARRKHLEPRAAAPEDPVPFVTTELGRNGAVRRAGLLVRSRFSGSRISETVAALIGQSRVIAAGDWLADACWWKDIRKRAEETIDAEHRLRPQLNGLPLNDLRKVLDPVLPQPDLFDLVVADLTKTGFIQTGTVIRRATHRPALPAQLQGPGQRLRGVLSAKPFDPPSRKELAPDALNQQALRFLLETGEATEIGSEVVLLTESYHKAKEMIIEFLRQQGRGTVSEIRQKLGASRRIVVPLLERLDREGVTKREGDYRVLRARG